MLTRKLIRKTAVLLAGSRWKEYEDTIRYAKDSGYKLMGIVEYYQNYLLSKDKVLVLRHDVDNDPKFAIKMAHIEAKNNCSSTYYFRKETSGKYIKKIKDFGFEIGLYYETVAEYCIEKGISKISSENEEHVRIDCLKRLADDVLKFKSEFGECNTVAFDNNSIDASLSYPGNRLFDTPDSYDIVPVLVEANNKELINSFDEYVCDGNFFIGGFRYRSSVRQAIDKGCNKIYFLSHPGQWKRQSLFGK